MNVKDILSFIGEETPFIFTPPFLASFRGVAVITSV